MQAICETTRPLHDPKWLVVLQDQPIVVLQSLQALVVRQGVEKDRITHLVFGFLSMMIDIFLHLSCGVGEGLPHILQ